MDIPQDPSDGIRAYIKMLITSKLREGLPLRQISDVLNLEVLNLALDGVVRFRMTTDNMINIPFKKDLS